MDVAWNGALPKAASTLAPKSFIRKKSSRILNSLLLVKAVREKGGRNSQSRQLPIVQESIV
eukprot:5274062-Karenia_brevis.AAC.1